MRYTIHTAIPTGKVDPTYGAEYTVTFNEDSREVKMNRKFPPKAGTELIGEIISASWGSYFKKDPNANNQIKTVSDTPMDSSPSNKNLHTMYVSYAKDLLLAYMSSLDWNFDKVSEEGFDIALRLIVEGAKALESEA